MYFTIVMPTRDRLDLLYNTICSIRDTAKNLNSFELIIIADIDDVRTQDAIASWWGQFNGMNIRFLIRERSQNISHDYYNWVFLNKSPVTPQGKVFWVIGNDVVFLTPDWDELARTSIENYLKKRPDRILYAFPKDISRNKPHLSEFNWGWFPILTRETVKALNYFMPEQYPSWGADVLLGTIFSNKEVNRSLELPIQLDHICYHSYKNIKQDHLGKRMSDHFNKLEQRQLRNGFSAWGIPLAINNLKEAIHGMVK